MNPFLTHELQLVRELRAPGRQAQAEFLDLLVRLGLSTWVDATRTEFEPTSFDIHFHDPRTIGG